MSETTRCGEGPRESAALAPLIVEAKALQGPPTINSGHPSKAPVTTSGKEFLSRKATSAKCPNEVSDRSEHRVPIVISGRDI